MPVTAVIEGVFDLYGDELGVLESGRRAHSLAVSRKTGGVAELVPAALRADLVTAATLGSPRPD